MTTVIVAIACLFIGAMFGLVIGCILAAGQQADKCTECYQQFRREDD